MSDTIVVIPCFNEAGRLSLSEFASFARRHRECRLLFVNDGSTDATGDVLAQLRQSTQNLVLVRHLPQNAGKAEAVRQGLLDAFRYSPRYVGFWDADLATPLADIHTFRAILEQRRAVQIVLGSRIALLGRSIERSYRRHLCGRVFARTASLVLGLPVYDTQCGAKLLRASPRMQAVFEQPFQSRWIFDVEILARLTAVFGKDMAYEQPLDSWQDVAGSKLRWNHFIRAAHDLAIIWKTYRKGYHIDLGSEQLRAAA